jgi:hypothetical protein
MQNTLGATRLIFFLTGAALAAFAAPNPNTPAVNSGAEMQRLHR